MDNGGGFEKLSPSSGHLHPREKPARFSVSYIFYRHRRSILVYFSIIALIYTGVQLYGRQGWPRHDETPYRSTAQDAGIVGTTQPGWKFDPVRDRANHKLTRAQCSAAFPDLYVELDRALDLWKAKLGRKKLTRAKNMDFSWSEGGLQGMIHDQNVGIRVLRAKDAPD